MGTLGWTRCYWCSFWVHNPYIIDWVEHPLCEVCFDWCIVRGGGPYEPTAQQRCQRVLERWFPHLPSNGSLIISEYLGLKWYDP